VREVVRKGFREEVRHREGEVLIGDKVRFAEVHQPAK
jgi:hypothetical protein